MARLPPGVLPTTPAPVNPAAPEMHENLPPVVPNAGAHGKTTIAAALGSARRLGEPVPAAFGGPAEPHGRDALGAPRRRPPRCRKRPGDHAVGPAEPARRPKGSPARRRRRPTAREARGGLNAALPPPTALPRSRSRAWRSHAACGTRLPPRTTRARRKDGLPGRGAVDGGDGGDLVWRGFSVGLLGAGRGRSLPYMRARMGSSGEVQSGQAPLAGCSWGCLLWGRLYWAAFSGWLSCAGPAAPADATAAHGPDRHHAALTSGASDKFSRLQVDFASMSKLGPPWATSGAEVARCSRRPPRPD